MLYLVATPIGNLDDFSFRAIETLKNCDYILCEDTRHSRILLDHYDIKKTLYSFHKFTEASREDKIIADLKNDKMIALISDAGTPGIADPGERLIKRCHQEGLPFSAIPGSCAVIQALICSGLTTQPFQFIGFLPRKSGELKDTIIKALLYNGTTIAYESPKRLLNTLQTFIELDPKIEVTICRELTKRYEDIRLRTVKEHLDYWKTQNIRGEIALAIKGLGDKTELWECLSPEDHLEKLIQDFSLSRKEALKLAAEIRHIPKKELYRRFCIQ